MFDIGFGEIVVIGGASFLLLGKRDMPLIFRLVGRAVGKVSGMVQGGRARMIELSKGNELMELQNEIKSNLDDLRVIKAELRGAARLPAGVTANSHPGTQIIREQARTSAGSFAGASPQPSYSSSSAINDIGSIVDITAGTGSAPAARRTPFSDGPLAAVGPSTGIGRNNPPIGQSSPSEGAQRAGLYRDSVQSVRTPGGDRLQQLAMAEVGFSQQGLYAPKTDAMSGGADVVNETITDSLLQERLRGVLASAKKSVAQEGDLPPTTST